MNGWVPFRLDPKMPVHAYQTYGITRPPGTHSRRATCAEVDCVASARGWSTKVDVSTDLGRRQANYIRLASGRSYTHSQKGTVVTFMFAAGQRCFAEHRVNVERPSLFLKRGGDWRAGWDAVQMRDVDWVDDFANHQQDIAERIERG